MGPLSINIFNSFVDSCSWCKLRQKNPALSCMLKILWNAVWCQVWNVLLPDNVWNVSLICNVWNVPLYEINFIFTVSNVSFFLQCMKWTFDLQCMKCTLSLHCLKSETWWSAAPYLHLDRWWLQGSAGEVSFSGNEDFKIIFQWSL